MAKSIYVGNLPWSATEEPVQSLFADYGPVVSVKLVSDRETGRARGFGFVEMEEPGASAAIEALDNANFGGRTLRVNEAKPRAPRPPLLVGLDSSAPRCPHRGAFFMPGPIGKASRREPGQAAETCVLWKAGAPFYTASRYLLQYIILLADGVL